MLTINSDDEMTLLVAQSTSWWSLDAKVSAVGVCPLGIPPDDGLRYTLELLVPFGQERPAHS